MSMNDKIRIAPNVHRRRQVLKALGMGIGVLAAGSPALVVRNAWAAAAPAAGNDGRMIVIFLRGALDGLFALAPVDDRNLAALRPNLSR